MGKLKKSLEENQRTGKERHREGTEGPEGRTTWGEGTPTARKRANSNSSEGSPPDPRGTRRIPVTTTATMAGYPGQQAGHNGSAERGPGAGLNDPEGRTRGGESRDFRGSDQRAGPRRRDPGTNGDPTALTMAAPTEGQGRRGETGGDTDGGTGARIGDTGHRTQGPGGRWSRGIHETGGPSPWGDYRTSGMRGTYKGEPQETPMGTPNRGLYQVSLVIRIIPEGPLNVNCL